MGGILNSIQNTVCRFWSKNVKWDTLKIKIEEAINGAKTGGWYQEQCWGVYVARGGCPLFSLIQGSWEWEAVDWEVQSGMIERGTDLSKDCRGSCVRLYLEGAVRPLLPNMKYLLMRPAAFSDCISAEPS